MRLNFKDRESRVAVRRGDCAPGKRQAEHHLSVVRTRRMARGRSLTNWHYCDYGNLHYKKTLCAECSEEMSRSLRRERQQGKAKLHLARESRQPIRWEATPPKDRLPTLFGFRCACCGVIDSVVAPDHVRPFPKRCLQACSMCVRNGIACNWTTNSCRTTV